MQKLRDKIAIVTGGTSGIGRACAEAFAREGAVVVVAGRRKDVGEDLARQLGHGAVFVATDVARPADVEALVKTTVSRFGRIDMVVNNAGSTSMTGPIAETDPAAFDADLAVHLRAPFLAMKFASPTMAARGGGSFINMSSISGIRAGYNVFGYEVAKAALVHLTRCAALELGEKGIRVNAISPGPTRTGIFAKAGGVAAGTADSRMAEVERAFASILPAVQALPGMIHAEDVANAAVFLASDDARFINGHDLVIDGGIVAGQPAAAMRAGWEALGSGLAKAGVV